MHLFPISLFFHLVFILFCTRLWYPSLLLLSYSHCIAFLVYVGVDGGGTKTAVSVVDGSGQVLSSAKAGGSNHNSVGEKKAAAEVLSGIQQAVSLAKEKVGGPVEVKAILLGMSGVDRDGDDEMVKGWLRTEYKDAEMFVYNDAVPALVSGTNGTLEGVGRCSLRGWYCFGSGVCGRIGRGYGMDI